jgi:hypothetical protein
MPLNIVGEIFPETALGIDSKGDSSSDVTQGGGAFPKIAKDENDDHDRR